MGKRAVISPRHAMADQMMLPVRRYAMIAIPGPAR